MVAEFVVVSVPRRNTFEHRARRGNDFRSDAVTGEQSDGGKH
jgi:hypothetical protein